VSVISVIDRLDDVTEPQWNRLADDGSFHLSYDWLRYIESEATEQPRYVLARDGEDLCGALPLYRVLEPYRPLYRGEHFSDLLGFTGEALVAGACRGFHCTLLLPGAHEAPDRQATLAAVVERARQEAAGEGYAGLVFPYLTTEALRGLAEVAQVRAAYDMTEAEMVVASGGFDAYVEQAPRRVRSKLRSDRDRFERAGWTVRERDLADCWPDVARLLDNLQHKYQHTEKTRADHERVLAAQARHMGADSVTFSVEDDDGIAGLAVFYRWRSTMFGAVAGFDYDRLRNGREYFNVTVCAPLEYAAKAGIERLHLGVASWEAKGYRGALLRPLWSAFIAASPAGAAEPPGLDLVNDEAARQQAAEIIKRGIQMSPPEWQPADRLPRLTNRLSRRTGRGRGLVRRRAGSAGRDRGRNRRSRARARPAAPRPRSGRRAACRRRPAAAAPSRGTARRPAG
jgi:predicted N-acyltransferase